MARRQQVLTELACHIVRLSPERIIRVAVDGVDGAGKATFANELADAICPVRRSVIRASVDGFHNPRAIRYERGRHSPDGYFENSYNYAALKQYLLDPLSPGGCRRYCAAVFDHVTDRPVRNGRRNSRGLAGNQRIRGLERLHEEFKRRIKTQTVLPSAETAAMLFWALLASGQISMRKVDGWKTLSEKSPASSAQPVDLAA